MKTIFIPAKFKARITVPKLKIKQKIALVTTIQFLDQLKSIQKQLEKQGIKSIIAGQVLGCNVEAATRIQDKIQAFLYIGSGKFHPLSIAMALKKHKPIYIYNPLTKEFSKLKQEDINRAQAKKKAAKIKFLSANKIGLLVSTKPGQNKARIAEKIRKNLEKKGKKCYIFLFNDFNQEQLENFPEIEAWINTFCPGLSLENSFLWHEYIGF
jgi:2-(3-amino-3-carboxypropyl)histidine synthase